MADFDLDGARKAGYSDAEIADHLGAAVGFNTNAARKAGYSDSELISHLMTQPSAPAPKITHPPAAAPEPDHTFLGDVAHNALGAGEIAGASVANAAGAVGNAASDLVTRATGFGPSHPIPTVKTGKAAEDFVQGAVDSAERGNEAIGMGDKLATAAGATDKAAGAVSAATPDVVKEHVLPVAGDVLTLAGARGLTRGGPATSAGAAVQNAGRAVATGTTAASTAADEAAAAAQAASQARQKALGFKTGQESTAGKILAGDTAKPALVNHNSDVFNAVGNAESGVPHGTPLGAGSLAAAREAPGAVVDRVGRALPGGNLDGPATIRVNNAGAEITDAASRQQVANMRELMAQSMTGEQRMQQLRQFRQEAYSRLSNEGANSVDQQAVGKAQLEMANAIEDHIARNLPKNADVSLEQYQAARKALAKNYTIENSLRGTDVDPNKLAAIARHEPKLLDGDLAEAARFANENREVVGLPTRLNAPGVAKDLSNVNPLKLGSLGSAVTAGQGPALGRRLLTGGSAAGRATARGAAPGRLGDEFAPLTPQPPQPPPGMAVAGEGAGGPHGPPAGNNSDLASVMSHGVEQPPPPGLTAGPMGAPPAQGIPFTRNAAHEAGELSLGDHVAELHRMVGSNSDLPGVMSQGVPEGTMTRTPQRPPGARMPSAGKLGNMLANNASGESAASQEAINRGTRDLVQVDPDGRGSPLLRDVTQIDARAPKGHLIVDRRTGEIIDRGGMNQRMAEGLRNRYASRVRLGDNFAPPRD